MGREGRVRKKASRLYINTFHVPINIPTCMADNIAGCHEKAVDNRAVRPIFAG